MNKRHQEILNIISKNEEISVNTLSEVLGVSLVTIRSDLRQLDEKNLLLRTHGGACLPSTDDISRRISINYTVKQKIAAAAAACVQEGETILLEAGSSVALMARELVKKRNLNIITNNAFVARQLKEASGVRVIMLGGVFQKESESMIGPMVREYLAYYNFSRVFLGMDGFTPELGFMNRDPGRAEVMTDFVRQAELVYFLSDSSKLGKKALKTICMAEKVDYLVTDDSMTPEYRTFFKEKGVGIIT